MTTLMQSDPIGKGDIQLLDLEDVGEKLGQFKGSCFDVLKAGVVLIEEIPIVVRHHRDATSRGADDVLVIGKNSGKALC